MSERLFHLAAAGFEAARRLPALPVDHRSHGLHGHSFLARVGVDLPPGWASFPGAEIGMLGDALRACVGELDYRDLNEHLALPTDENLARWVRDRLGVPGIVGVGIRSSQDQGVDLGGDDQVRVWRRFRFEAAHRLPNVPQGHQCGRMHGHGFEIRLHADQASAGRRTGVDGDRLAALWAPVGAELDHSCLNDIRGLENPTSELLSHWLWQRLKPELPALCGVTVQETATAGCHYDGCHYSIWKDQRFEGALRLAGAPAGDARRRLHGHSYLLRLYLTAPLDPVLGWTLDFGDVKSLFKPVYECLNHRRLDELADLSGADPASLTLWIRETAAPILPQLDRIDLNTRPGCGASLCWGLPGRAVPI